MIDPLDNTALQIAIVYVALLVLGLIPLSATVIRQRRGKRIGIGDGGDKELAKAIRVHGNYTEYVPFGLAVLFALPLIGSPVWVIHVVGLALIAGRVAHSFGLSRSTGSSTGRVIGMVLTLTGLIFGSLFLLWHSLT